MFERSLFARIWRLFHTVRHLRLKQIIFQIWYRLNRGSVPTTPTYKLRELQHVEYWIAKPECWEPRTAFTFLNERREHRDVVEWEQVGAGKLWLYNLHYFDYLGVNESQSSYKADCAEIIEDWIVQNTPINGNAWEPYPTSLRIVNWIKWHLNGPGLSQAALDSLAQQVCWLESRLEYHIQANHLFANGKALAFAGMFFDGPVADKWLLKGTKLVSEELEEQILEDGAHFELSPMYHAIMLEDTLDLINLATGSSQSVPKSDLTVWRDTAKRMLQWMDSTLHPDGDIAFFNDAAFGIARTPSQIREYARQLSVFVGSTRTMKSEYFSPSGLAMLRNDALTVIADVGATGPAYQPGHAHADTLSCEISIGTERVFVNSGTSTYVKGNLRDLQRSTAAHNTLELGHRNSSDVWDGFRVASRAYIGNIKWNASESQTTLSAEHNGYRFLPGKPQHRREWLLDGKDLQVVDFVNCTSGNTIGNELPAITRWLLHPSIDVLDNNILKTNSGLELTWSSNAAFSEVVPAFWYPQFGVEETTHCIVLTSGVLSNSEMQFSLTY